MLNFPRWKIAWIFLVCAFGVVSVFPNFLEEENLENIPDWLPSSQITLGLDLQGGSHMLLEVDVATVITERLDTLQDDIRTSLRQESIGYTGLGIDNGTVVFRLRNIVDEDKVDDIIDGIAQPIVNNLGAIAQQDIEVDFEDDGRAIVSLTEPGILEMRQNAVAQSIEIVRRRVDEMGTKEPTIQRQGVDRILVQVPGLQDPRALREMLNTTAKLSFHMVDETTSQSDIQRGRVAPGSRVLPNINTGVDMAVRRRAILTGENLVDSNPTFDQNGSPAVGFRFDVQGAKKFGDITRNNSGRFFAIVLDDEIISAPRINEPILGGSGQIVGGFTVETANNLSILLRAGALPAPLTILEERTVGADMGADAVEAGTIASIIGFIAVIVFIILTYGWFGVAANVALIFNIALLGGLLSTIGATLTLPGVAGIVLTIGMAVDANVLIFERIREELKLGRNPFQAVDSGYGQALSTILDANITTLIAAVILFQFGSGPVKGFAVTLTFGIVTSVFTAVTLTRLFISLWLRRKRPSTLKL